MTSDEFIEAVAAMVAGLQVPVSLMPRQHFGAAYEPWQRLLDIANGGFGWTTADKCEEAFKRVLLS